MAITLETVRPSIPFAIPESFILDFHGHRLTDEQFEELCRNHEDLKFEMSAKGELIIVPPTDPESGSEKSELNYQVVRWNKIDKKGKVFDSSSMFTFPNGAKRSPDVSWMPREKWASIGPSERQKFSRVVPDFVIELISPTDNLHIAKAKLEEYIENGVRLGWLIDPFEKRVYIYRKNREIDVLDDPETVSGEDVLEGFDLNMQEFWESLED